MANRRRRLRLIAGGLVGGAIVIAGRRRRRALLPGGLRAFEDAPCYRAEHGPPQAAALDPTEERETSAA
jgi:hypothetical protein